MPTLRQLLAQPEHGFAHTPFWFWNGALDPDVMRHQMEMMADKKVMAAMPHPRFGMDRRAYLEEPYWKAMDATVAAAKRLGGHVLLYDEYNWPSGCAGGRVTAGRPDLQPHGLDYETRDVSGPGRVTLDGFSAGEPMGGRFDHLVGAFLVPADCPVLDAGLTGPGEEAAFPSTPWGELAADRQSVSGHLPAGPHRILVFFQATGGNASPLNPGSGAFVDFLNPEVGRRFIELTHEQYRKRYGQHFGKLIPAIFTDEPSTLSGGPFPWTGDFAAEFARRRGFDLLEELPALCDERYPGGYAIRAAYWQTLAELFEERFLGQLSDWCRANHIALTGHIFDEYLDGWTCATHLMNWLRRFDWPGIDALGKHSMAEGCKIAASVAHLDGKPHFLCEALGLADGWNATLGMAKRGYQFLGVMGVDVFVPHGFHQTVENPRVECPPSWFYQNPYWAYYRQVADLTARLSHFNQSGRHVAPVAVYYPIESLWADGTGGRGRHGHPWQAKAHGNARAKQTIRFFNEAIGPLSAGPYDCDVVDTRYLLEAEIDETTGELLIGPERFACLVMPGVRTIPLALLEKLERFALAGGLIVFTGRYPERCYPESAIDPRAFLTALAQRATRHGGSAIWTTATPQELLALLDREITPIVVFEGERPQGILSMARRSADTTQWLVVNDLETPRSFSLTLPRALLPAPQAGESLKVWTCRLETGESIAQPFSETPAGLRMELGLGHTEALIVMVEAQATSTLQTVNVGGSRGRSPSPEAATPCDAQGREGERRRESVLELPRWTFQLVPMEFSGREAAELTSAWVDLPVWKMRERGWNRLPGWERPDFDDGDWPTVAALRGEACVKGEVALLRTRLPPGAGAIRLPLPVTGEYVLHVNGQRIEECLGLPPADGERRLDGFTRGLNDVVAIEVASESDWAGLSAPLRVLCGPVQLESIQRWAALGLPWYVGRAAYRTRFELPAMPGHAWLDLGNVEHGVEIWVNGILAGIRLWAPYGLDIVRHLHQGGNEVCLIVSNSVVNRFVWDKWSESRTGASWGVPPRAEPSGLLTPPRLLWRAGT